MAILLGNWYERIKGGWKTVGAPGVGAFDYGGEDWIPTSVGPISAMKLSAYFACCRLLSETMGSMSFQLYDNANNIVTENDLYGLMRDPNSDQTSDAFISAMTGNKTVFGNAIAHIKRYQSTGRAYALDFYSTDLWTITSDSQGRPKFALNGDDVRNEDVLHWAGFSLNGYWGLPTLVAGGEVMSAQIDSNRAASRTFKSGLRAGGFFTLPENRQAFTDPQLEKFKLELAKMSEPQNTARWLPLLPGMKAESNTGYRIDPVTAELLQSRHFGIEEICRFMGVPPPLIGHTDKASSWASSLDGLNQFLVTYTLLPQAKRFENEIGRKLLGRNERSKLKPTFNMDSLLRGDIQKRFETYKIGIDKQIYVPNEVRRKENMPDRPGGDVVVVKQPANPAKGKKDEE